MRGNSLLEIYRVSLLPLLRDMRTAKPRVRRAKMGGETYFLLGNPGRFFRHDEDAVAQRRAIANG